MTRYCALNLNSESVYLDHICPLASVLKIPLIVSDWKNAALTSKYYPEVDARYFPDFVSRFGELAEQFDALIGCEYKLAELNAPFQMFYQKKMRFILCPHGQSDKGYNFPCLDGYAKHKEVLLYGNLMKKMLQDLDLFSWIEFPITVGNFRFQYYQTFKERVLKVAEEEVFSRLNSSCKTLLYAPTWKDPDGSTTFFDVIEKLIKETPFDWNVIVKMHPLLSSRDPVLFHRLSILEETRPGIIFLDEFPLVYPILEKIDAYLGDYSSVGYDVLAFEKPMFFLKKNDLRPPKLHCCGPILDASKNIFHSIEEGMEIANQYLPYQKALYKEAFAENESLFNVFR